VGRITWVDLGVAGERAGAFGRPLLRLPDGLHVSSWKDDGDAGDDLGVQAHVARRVALELRGAVAGQPGSSRPPDLALRRPRPPLFRRGPLGAGRTTTKSGRWLSAFIGPGIPGSHEVMQGTDKRMPAPRNPPASLPLARQPPSAPEVGPQVPHVVLAVPVPPAIQVGPLGSGERSGGTVQEFLEEAGLVQALRR
jgi:hypothetical protein